MEFWLHHCGVILEEGFISGSLRTKSTGQDLHVNREIAGHLIGTDFFYGSIFIHRLTGTPHPHQWPDDISVPRETFAHRLQKRPIDLCPELDEYANDLLMVSDARIYQLSIDSNQIPFTFSKCWHSIHVKDHQPLNAWIIHIFNRNPFKNQTTK